MNNRVVQILRLTTELYAGHKAPQGSDNIHQCLLHMEALDNTYNKLRSINCEFSEVDKMLCYQLYQDAKIAIQDYFNFRLYSSQFAQTMKLGETQSQK
jgi:hypothetical protein